MADCRACHVSLQRHHMSATLFNVDHLKSYLPVTGTGQVVIIAFVRAVTIMLQRLRECNPSAGPCAMRGLCILALPLPDVLPRAGGLEELRAAVGTSAEVCACVCVGVIGGRLSLQILCIVALI